jgi:hypothetical protein
MSYVRVYLYAHPCLWVHVTPGYVHGVGSSGDDLAKHTNVQQHWHQHAEVEGCVHAAFVVGRMLQGFSKETCHY